MKTLENVHFFVKPQLRTKALARVGTKPASMEELQSALNIMGGIVTADRALMRPPLSFTTHGLKSLHMRAPEHCILPALREHVPSYRQVHGR